MVIKNDLFQIIFGDMRSAYPKYSFIGSFQADLLAHVQAVHELKASHLIILDQIHSAQGYLVPDLCSAQLAPYSQQGDYTITSLSGVALAIETADCIPLVLVDAFAGRIAAVHAGWRGVAAGIVDRVIDEFLCSGSRLQDIQLFFGPSARGCCYEVDHDFNNHFDASARIIQRDGKIFFDLIDYVSIQLKRRGVCASSLVCHAAQCTICDSRYCSYRRQGALNMRQMTIVTLV